MKLLGEDSPVSKLQVKLEPGTHCCQDLLQALQTSPHRTSLPTLSSVPSWIPAKARPGQEPPAPGRPPVGSLSLPAPVPGSEQPSPWCVGPQCPPPQPLRQSRPHHCTPGASGCVRDSSPQPLLLCSLTPATPRSHRTQEGQSTTQSWGVLAGVNPSHLMNLFTYEKGYCFVYYLSQLCGDPQRFDDFLRVSSPSCPTPPRLPGLLLLVVGMESVGACAWGWDLARLSFWAVLGYCLFPLPPSQFRLLSRTSCGSGGCVCALCTDGCGALLGPAMRRRPQLWGGTVRLAPSAASPAPAHAGLCGEVQVHQRGGPGPAGLLPELLPGAEGAKRGLPGR